MAFSSARASQWSPTSSAERSHTVPAPPRLCLQRLTPGLIGRHGVHPIITTSKVLEATCCDFGHPTGTAHKGAGHRREVAQAGEARWGEHSAAAADGASGSALMLQETSSHTPQARDTSSTAEPTRPVRRSGSHSAISVRSGHGRTGNSPGAGQKPVLWPSQPVRAIKEKLAIDTGGH